MTWRSLPYHTAQNMHINKNKNNNNNNHLLRWEYLWRCWSLQLRNFEGGTEESWSIWSGDNLDFFSLRTMTVASLQNQNKFNKHSSCEQQWKNEKTSTTSEVNCFWGSFPPVEFWAVCLVRGVCRITKPPSLLDAIRKARKDLNQEHLWYHIIYFLFHIRHHL